MADGKEQKCMDTVDANIFFGKRKHAAGTGNDRTTVDMDYSSSSKSAASDPYRYKMDYPCIGTCLIINNKNFHKSTGMMTRNGAEADVVNLRSTFSKLGYKVRVVNDQTVAKMKALLLNASKEDHSKSASFVCVLLSHGDEGVIYGTDGAERFETLTECFKGHRCTSLVGKPKLFFVDANRGSALDEGALIELDSVADEQISQRIPLEADFLYAFSTAPGYYSWKNTTSGSWFIKALCESLQRFGGELELMHVMTRVNHRVSQHFESSCSLPGFSCKKQTPCIVSMLTKHFYFPV